MPQTWRIDELTHFFFCKRPSKYGKQSYGVSVKTEHGEKMRWL